MLVRRKISIGFIIVGFILLLSSLIAIFEFYTMKNTVSKIVINDIEKINDSHKLLSIAEEFNDRILLSFQNGDENLKDEVKSIKSDRTFNRTIDSLREAIENSLSDFVFRENSSQKQLLYVDSVRYTYFAHIYHIAQLQKLTDSVGFSSRDWYLDKFYPNHSNLLGYIRNLSTLFQEDFISHSSSLNEGFRRSLMPCIVAVVIGIILLFLFNYFLNFYFMNPLDKITKGIKSYVATHRSYDYNLESGDEIEELNDNVRELISENRKLIKEKNQ